MLFDCLSLYFRLYIGSSRQSLAYSNFTSQGGFSSVSLIPFDLEVVNMAVVSSSFSSCFSSMSTLKKYDVFLSFRGEDTRANFISHLHAKLRQKNIEAYMDDRLEKGGEISPILLKAIEESKISVVIFSENYLSSSWCLDELLHIFKCKEMNGQVIVPVFLPHRSITYKKSVRKICS